MISVSLLLVLAATAQQDVSPDDPFYTPPRRRPPRMLQIGVLERNATCTSKVQRGDEVEIGYKMYLFVSGKLVDYTKDNESFIFRVGYSQTLEGLDQGVLGMCIGEKRKLQIPAYNAYGMRGASLAVPGGQSLIMEVTLIDFFPLEYDDELADEKMREKMENEERAKEGDFTAYLKKPPFNPKDFHIINQRGGEMLRTYHHPPDPTIPRRVRDKPEKRKKPKKKKAIGK
ncbi:putative FK506-binding protein 2B [Blattamonas nauphoetae]|uniref:peptidylprolyl isomerase n=1 Tax=Blattamonas nauphoetae TaxID=2049346 RepID=A0ABQ9YEQ2_9EUKA|nr:putative FK506-binding protein 2B [Blattamonas nauphoetae]